MVKLSKAIKGKKSNVWMDVKKAIADWLLEDDAKPKPDEPKRDIEDLLDLIDDKETKTALIAMQKGKVAEIDVNGIDKEKPAPATGFYIDEDGEIVEMPAPAPKPAPAPATGFYIDEDGEIVEMPAPAPKPAPAPEKLRWKVEGKTLTVGGVREIKFYSYGELPWVDSVDAIQHIVIEAGVEKISANAFAECKRLELLTIPASVKIIGDCAFTFCFCGNRAVNGGKNVLWSLDDGILTFKKNPDVRNANDFTIGAVSWRAVDKNITGVKVERGVIPDKKFFDWRKGLSRDVPISM